MISYKTGRIFACGLTVQEEQLIAHVLRKWAYLFTALHRKDFLFRISSDKIIIPSSKTISRYFPLLYIVIVIITLSGCGPNDRGPLVEYIICSVICISSYQSRMLFTIEFVGQISI